MVEPSAANNTGNYLHIEKVEIDKEHRGKLLALHLIIKTLSSLQWTITSIVPILLWPNENENLCDIEKVKVAQYFSRIGYKQLPGHGKTFWYMQRSDFTGEIGSAEAAATLQVSLLARRKPISAASKELLTLIIESSTSDENFLLKLQDLLSRGADMDACNALQTAVGARKSTLLPVLLAAGAQVNAQDENGLTALHVATGLMEVDMIIVRMLLIAGADKTLKDADGRTPRDELLFSRRNLTDFERAFGLPRSSVTAEMDNLLQML